MIHGARGAGACGLSSQPKKRLASSMLRSPQSDERLLSVIGQLASVDHQLPSVTRQPQSVGRQPLAVNRILPSMTSRRPLWEPKKRKTPRPSRTAPLEGGAGGHMGWLPAGGSGHSVRAREPVMQFCPGQSHLGRRERDDSRQDGSTLDATLSTTSGVLEATPCEAANPPDMMTHMPFPRAPLRGDSVTL